MVVLDWLQSRGEQSVPHGRRQRSETHSRFPHPLATRLQKTVSPACLAVALLSALSSGILHDLSIFLSLHETRRVRQFQLSAAVLLQWTDSIPYRLDIQHALSGHGNRCCQSDTDRSSDLLDGEISSMPVAYLETTTTINIAVVSLFISLRSRMGTIDSRHDCSKVSLAESLRRCAEVTLRQHIELFRLSIATFHLLFRPAQTDESTEE